MKIEYSAKPKGANRQILPFIVTKLVISTEDRRHMQGLLLHIFAIFKASSSPLNYRLMPQVLEQESRLPLDLSRDCSKLAGREVRLLQGGQDEDRASLPLLGTLKHLSTSPAALRTEGKARPKSSPARGRGDNGGFVETDQGGCGEEGRCVAVGRSTEYLNPPSGGTR